MGKEKKRTWQYKGKPITESQVIEHDAEYYLISEMIGLPDEAFLLLIDKNSNQIDERTTNGVFGRIGRALISASLDRTNIFFQMLKSKQLNFSATVALPGIKDVSSRTLIALEIRKDEEVIA